MSAPKITFLICSWQAPVSLEETLASIARQPDLSACETVLINNGFSAERAAALMGKFPAQGLRIIEERRPGLGFARHTGLQNVRGEAVVLLDDDNTIAPDFVARLTGLMVAYPNWGGIRPAVFPAWAEEPPVWLPDFGRLCLSYNTVSAERLSETPRVWRYPALEAAERPPGGGMIVHRTVAEKYVQIVSQEARINMGRIRQDLGGCEDDDIFSNVKAVCRDVVASDRLQVWHHIPQSRTHLKYLLRLNYAMLRSYGVLNQLRGEKPPGGLIALVRALKNAVWPPLGGWLRGRISARQMGCEWARNFGWLAGFYFQKVEPVNQTGESNS